MVLCGGMAMDGGGPSSILCVDFPKVRQASECARTTEYPSLEGLVTGLEINFPFIVLFCPLVVEPRQNSQDLSAESSILGISNDGTEDGYDDGERVKKVP